MGYSRNKATLNGILTWFDKLKQGVGDKWVLPEGVSPEKFAYKIREGLYIASLYPEVYPELAEAQKNFKVEVVDRKTVQAIFRPRRIVLAKGGESTGATVVHGLEPGEKGPTTLAGQQTAASIIQAWHNTQPSNSPMSFPQAMMEREELLRLFQWCGKRTPPWLMLVSAAGAVTLSPYTRDLDGLGWDPSDD